MSDFKGRARGTSGLQSQEVGVAQNPSTCSSRVCPPDCPSGPENQVAELLEPEEPFPCTETPSHHSRGTMRSGPSCGENRKQLLGEFASIPPTESALGAVGGLVGNPPKPLTLWFLVLLLACDFASTQPKPLIPEVSSWNRHHRSAPCLQSLVLTSAVTTGSSSTFPSPDAGIPHPIRPLCLDFSSLFPTASYLPPFLFLVPR